MICRNCDGKGHVLAGITLLNLVVLCISPFERNDPNGLSRDECSKCDGRGYIEKRKEQ